MSAPLSGSEKTKPFLEFDEFRVDPVRRLLLRDGEPVVITPKAFSILLVLLERPGEVVEKEDLLKRVWPDTFVTEANLVQNVSSLRKSLGERANGARYVVTVSGMGYSFTGEVREVERHPTQQLTLPPEEVQEVHAAAAIVPLPAEPPPAAAVEAPPAEPAVWRHLLVVAAVLLVGVVLTVAAFGLLRARTSAPTSPDAPAVRRSVAVLGLADLSPKQETRWLGTALAEMLTTELAAGGNVRVISGDRIAEAVRALALPPADRLGPRELERLRGFLGADLVLVGSYLALDGRLRLDLRVLGVPAGETVASVAETGTEVGLFDLVSHTGVRLRRELGFEELSPGQEQEAQSLRPANQEATRLYFEGLEKLRAFDPPGARDLLERAAQADPGSAMIRSALSKAWGDLGVDARAVEEAGKAVDLAGGLPRKERLEIQARFHAARREWDEASRIYRSLFTFFPDDLDIGIQSAMSQMTTSRPEEAEATIAALRRFPAPMGEDPRIDLAAARLGRRLSDPVQQEKNAAAAVAKVRRSGQLLLLAQALVYQGDALLILGKREEGIRCFQEAGEAAERTGDQWTQGMALGSLGLALHRKGDLQGSRAAQEKALGIAQQLGTAFGGARQQGLLGNLYRDLGNLPEAQASLERARVSFAAISDRSLETSTLNDLGTVLADRGELQELRRTAERVLGMARQLGSRADEARALAHMATVLEWRGELTEARDLNDRAHDILTGVGDSGTAAAALAASAELTAQLGNLRAGRRQAELALAAKRAAGDWLGVGAVLGSRARLAEWAGDLPAFGTAGREQLAIARETGGRLLAAAAAQNLGRAALARGDLVAARRWLDEALRTAVNTGEHLRAADVRVDLARLALAEGKMDAAAYLAREAAAWYAAQGIENEIRAWALVAEAHLRRGKLAAAREAAARVRAWRAHGQNRELQAAVTPPLARVDAAGGEVGKAVHDLRQAIDEATAAGFTIHALEARLALGEIQAGAKDLTASATLVQVRDQARARGLGGIARRAEAVLSGLALPGSRSL